METVAFGKSAHGPLQILQVPNAQKESQSTYVDFSTPVKHDDYLSDAHENMDTGHDHIDLVDSVSATAIPAIVESPPTRAPSSRSSDTTLDSKDRDKPRPPLGSLAAVVSASRLRTTLSSASTVTSHRRDASISAVLQSSKDDGSYYSYESPSYTSGSSASEDSGSHVSSEDILDSMLRHWETLSTQRLEVRKLLDDLRRARTNLKDLAQAKDDADRELELAIRSERFKTDRDTLEPYLVAYSTSKLKYQEAETTVDQLIDNVDDATFEADIIERRFYNRLERRNLDADVTESVHEFRRAHHAPSRMSLRGISPDRSEDLHPLYERLREVYGDFQLAKEYYNNLGYKHAVVQAEDYDLLGSDEIEFLEEFEESLSKAKSDVQEWSQRFEELRAECAEKNLIPKSSPFFEDDSYDGYDEANIFGPEEISLDEHLVDESTLSHSQYSLLVTNPKHVLNEPLPLTSQEALNQALMLPPNASGRNQAIQEAMHEHSIATLLQDTNPQDRNDYINRWLLQKLRISPMEVEVLSSTFRKILKILDLDRWQHDVLRFWTRDTTTEPAPDDTAVATHNKHEIGTLSNPSDKRAETRSQARSQAVSMPLLRRRNSYDDWEYLHYFHDGGQSE